MPFLIWRWSEQAYTVGTAVALAALPAHDLLDSAGSEVAVARPLQRRQPLRQVPHQAARRRRKRRFPSGSRRRARRAGRQGQAPQGRRRQDGQEDLQEQGGSLRPQGSKDNPDPHLAKKLAEENAKKAGILGVLKTNEGSHLASIFGRDTALGTDADNVLGGLIGNEIGEAYGVGGLGLVGTGTGGGGTGEGTIGLGNLGTIGKGGGGGNGSGYGRGAGGLGGRRAQRARRHPRPANVRGSLDKEIIRRIIRRHINEVKYCYEKELMKKADLSGRVSVQFTIAATGQVIASVLQSSTMGNLRVENCIVQAVRRWEFPKPLGGGIVIVSYPFVFTAAGWRRRVQSGECRQQGGLHEALFQCRHRPRRDFAGMRRVRVQSERIKAIEIANKGVEHFTTAYEAAERELRLSIQTDPTYEKAYYNLGKVYQAQRKWDKAAEAFESAVQRSPDNANFHYDLGEAYLEAKQLDKAETALKKATELDPQAVQGVLATGSGLHVRGKAEGGRRRRCARPSSSIRAWTSPSSHWASSI